MSDATDNPRGSTLKGVVAGIAVCAVGSVAAALTFPLAPIVPPVVASSDRADAFDPPVVVDTTDALLAPGQEGAFAEPSLDTTPTEPVADRDDPDIATETASLSVGPQTDAISVDAPVEDQSAPNVSVDAGPVAEGNAPALASTGDDTDFQAPQFDLTAMDSLSPPVVENETSVAIPSPATVAVATIEPSQQVQASDNLASQPIVELPQDDAVVALTGPVPAQNSDVGDVDLQTASTPDAPSIPAAITQIGAPEPEDQFEVASAIPAPPVINPIGQPDDTPGATVVVEPAEPGAAFEQFANTEFVPEPNKPFLALIIEDVGVEGVSSDTLSGIAAPLTIAVSPGNPAAAEYREQGFELVSRLAGADGNGISASIDEASLITIANALRDGSSQIVALTDSMDGDLHRNTRAMAQLARELKQSGHGLLTFERFGVGAAVNAIKAENVPHGSILRLLDENRDRAAVRRALDRAALEASKTGAAIVYARSYPETMSALVPWLLSNTAGSIQIAPLTATIQRASNR